MDPRRPSKLASGGTVGDGNTLCRHWADFSFTIWADSLQNCPVYYVSVNEQEHVLPRHMIRSNNTPRTRRPFIRLALLLLIAYIYSAILRSRADSLRSHVILHEWIAFYSAFFNVHRSGVLTALLGTIRRNEVSISAFFDVSLRPQRQYGLLKTGSPGRPPWVLLLEWLKCVFTSTETVRTIKDGQPRTAPLSSVGWMVEVLLYVHKNRREPRTSTSTFTQLLSCDSLSSVDQRTLTVTCRAPYLEMIPKRFTMAIIALFSASEQIHCVLVVCDSDEWL